MVFALVGELRAGVRRPATEWTSAVLIKETKLGKAKVAPVSGHKKYRQGSGTL